MQSNYKIGLSPVYRTRRVRYAYKSRCIGHRLQCRTECPFCTSSRYTGFNCFTVPTEITFHAFNLIQSRLYSEVSRRARALSKYIQLFHIVQKTASSPSPASDDGQCVVMQPFSNLSDFMNMA